MYFIVLLYSYDIQYRTIYNSKKSHAPVHNKFSFDKLQFIYWILVQFTRQTKTYILSNTFYLKCNLFG